MNREIKFRAWDGKIMHPNVGTHPSICMKHDGYKTLQDGALTICEWFDAYTLMQYTGMKDRAGKEIYEGDVVAYREPIRTTQTHYGDNIPNGAYTEPMEPAIKDIEGTVVFKNGCWSLEGSDHFDQYDKSGMCFELSWAVEQEYDEQGLRDRIASGIRNDIWDDEEEGDKQYLIQEYKFENIEQLLDSLKGCQVIGNIYQNPDLLN